MSIVNTSLSLAVSGAVIGFATGVLLQRSRLCLVAMVSNFVLIRDPGQLRAFLAAWAVAIIGTQALDWGGWVAIGESSYRGAQLDWLGATAGGLAFGFGAALAGGCAARTLAQAAEGNGGSLIALVAFAAMAALTQFGVLASYRMTLSAHSALRLASDDNSLAALTGVPALWLGAALALLCLMVALGIRREDRNWRLMLAGALAGVLVVAGWWATGWLSRDEFSAGRPESLTFSGPLARIGYALMTGETTGAIFGPAVALAAAAGAATSAAFARQLRWIAPRRDRIFAMLAGGGLMGLGSVLAGGCNIGQGMSGVSTLSAQSFLATAAMLAGVRLGVMWLASDD